MGCIPFAMAGEVPPASAARGSHDRYSVPPLLTWQEHGDYTATLRGNRGHQGWLETTATRWADQQQWFERVDREIQGGSSSSSAAGLAPKRAAKPADIRRMRAAATSVQPGYVLLKHVYFCNGRPVMIIQLTHERATAEEQVPYLASVLSPAPVLEVLGRAAEADPQVQRRHAVWYGWSDCILPLITSPQTPPDTLFLVFESDYRFSKVHSDVCRDVELATGVVGYGALPKRQSRAAAASVQPSMPANASERSADASGAWWSRYHPVSAAADAETNNRLLQALVGIANFAAKENAGGLVWMAWDTTVNKSRPCAGSTLLAVTKLAATHVALQMQ